ncbi:hypothetical protein AK830_g7738 [Neonectria ditissima]|uniref:ABM domain-containing protein n=1 Tax=Neonectria ditissima TaxID=78410 RepID=A0A0P7AM07_9HYPO|nr:hypothetical protein AK830_g7738 [Neonectria ditissima]
MPVTEFALLQLKPVYSKADFIEILRESLAIQDQWVREHQPHLLQDKPYDKLSAFYVQISDSPCLLINATWDTPEGHGEWLQSAENKSVFAKLAEYVADVSDSVVVFHMEPAAGSEAELRGDIFTQELSFSVCRISVNASQKESLLEKYRSIEAQARIANPNSRVWAGWRIEKDGDAEELVIFWSQGVLDTQLDGLLSIPDAEHELRQFQNVE